VVAVYDGDTVMVRSDAGLGRRVRLIGIDTPEIEEDPADTPLEALLAKRFTFHHLFRQRVKLTYDREVEDKYGRLLAYVWTNGELFNEFMLREGFARAYRKFPFGMEERFVQAQKQAKDEGRGLWNHGTYPFISSLQVSNHIGTLSMVRFVCARIQKSGRLLFLLAKSGRFAALIPEEHIPLFGDVQKMKGKTFQVFGFLEEYRGQPQIMLFFPSQIAEDLVQD
jgi:micrococcal nuclease